LQADKAVGTNGKAVKLLLEKEVIEGNELKTIIDE